MLFDHTQQESKKKTIRLWIFFCLAIVILLTCLQWHSLRNNFVSDDYDWVRNARERVERHDLFDAFKTPTGGNFYRPLVAFSFELDYALSGYSPVGYHIHQLIFHIALVLGVAFLVWQLFNRRALAFAVGLLFAVYPSQHEVVTWIAGRPDLYAATFLVFALAFFVLFMRKKQWWAYVLSLAFCLLGFLSKEISFVIPGLAILCLPVVLQKTPLKMLAKSLLWILPMLILLGGVFLVRSHVISDAIGGYLVGTERKGLDFETTNIAKPFTAIAYLVNWSFILDALGHVGSVAQSFFQKMLRHWVLMGAIVLAGTTFVVVKIKNREQRILLAFGVLWSLISFIPVYGLSGAMSLNLTASRLFFTSSIGYAMVFIALLWPFGEASRWKKLRVSLFIFLVVLFSGLWVLNYIPWAVASQKVQEIRNEFSSHKNELIPSGTTHVFVSSIPGLYDGAYMYFGVHSVRETIAELTHNESLNVFLGGNRAYSDSPLCQKTSNNHIVVFSWDQTTRQFVAGATSVTTRLNDPTFTEISKTWDFQDPSTLASWSLGGITAKQDATGVILDIPKGAHYFISPEFNEAFLSGYRSLTVSFNTEKTTKQFGDRRVLVSWGSHGTFNGSNYVTYSYSDKADQTITIPTCQFLNWILSEKITQIRIQPIAEGTILLRSISLNP